MLCMYSGALENIINAGFDSHMIWQTILRILRLEKQSWYEFKCLSHFENMNIFLLMGRPIFTYEIYKPRFQKR